jgi:hypothetical protein
LSHRHSWISVLIAIPGVAACVLALVGFLRKIVTNGLAFRKGLTASEHYRAVGEAYGDGFLTGFFLCFFLVLAVVALGAMMARRQRPHLVRRKTDAVAPVPFPGTPA